MSEQLRRSLQQQGVRAVFKSKTTLRSHLVRPKDAVDPAKQDGVVYRIPCECGKVYIDETGRPMQDRIKEHHRDIRFARTETSTISEHAHNTGHKSLWNEVKFIDRDPHYYTRRVKEAIHIRLHPDNINRDSGIEILEAWMPTIKKHNNRRAVRQRTAEGANHWVKQRGSKCTNQRCWKPTNHSTASCFIRSPMTSRPHRLKKTSSMQSKRRDLHHTWLHREINIFLI